MFLPATPAETPFHSSNLPLQEGAAAGRGMTPPGGEYVSCTAEGKTDACVTQTRYRSIF